MWIKNIECNYNNHNAIIVQWKPINLTERYFYALCLQKYVAYFFMSSLTSLTFMLFLYIILYNDKIIIKKENKIKLAILIFCYKLGNHESDAAAKKCYISIQDISIYPIEKILLGMVSVRFIGIHCIRYFF